MRNLSINQQIDHRLSLGAFLAVVLVTLLWLATVTLAESPSAEAVLEKYAQAVGGKESMAALRNRIAKGTLNIPDLGASGQMEVYSIPPDKSFTSIDFSAFGTVTSGVCGDVVWEINPMVGPRILKGAERARRLRQVQFDPFVQWSKHFKKADVVGEGTVAGSPCTKLALIPVEGEPITGFFDNESGLIVRMETVANGQAISTTLSDYRAVDGVKIPHRVQTNTPMMSLEILLESIEHNVDISDSRFDLPAEIQSLVDSSN
jgi:hypothetical protein